MTTRLKRIIIILLVVLLVLLLLLLLYRAIQRSKIKSSTGDTPDGVFPLSYGSGSDGGAAKEYVKVLQQYYNRFYVLPENGRQAIRVDGNWGSATEDAMAFISATSDYVIGVGSDGKPSVSESQYKNILNVLNQQQ